MRETNNPSIAELTEIENSILRYIAEGKNIGQISLILSTSVEEIEISKQNIMEKLQLFTVAELTKSAIQRGLTSVLE